MFYLPLSICGWLTCVRIQRSKCTDGGKGRSDGRIDDGRHGFPLVVIPGFEVSRTISFHAFTNELPTESFKVSGPLFWRSTILPGTKMRSWPII